MHEFFAETGRIPCEMRKYDALRAGWAYQPYDAQGGTYAIENLIISPAKEQNCNDFDSANFGSQKQTLTCFACAFFVLFRAKVVSGDNERVRKIKEYRMKFLISDLNVHPLFLEWMNRYFGEYCGATEILMLLTIVYIRNRSADDLDMYQMQVVGKIVGIATISRRPLRVPTRKEFESLLHDYDLEFYRNAVRRGAKLIPTRTAKEIVDAVLSYERAAALTRIDGPQAA